MITIKLYTVSVCFRYLGSGDSMISISYAFRIAHNTVSKIIKETCDAIWDCLNQDVLLKPTEQAWLNIAQDFEQRWQLPHCVGAIDGKHVVIQVKYTLYNIVLPILAYRVFVFLGTSKIWINLLQL